MIHDQWLFLQPMLSASILNQFFEFRTWITTLFIILLSGNFKVFLNMFQHFIPEIITRSVLPLQSSVVVRMSETFELRIFLFEHQRSQTTTSLLSISKQSGSKIFTYMEQYQAKIWGKSCTVCFNDLNQCFLKFFSKEERHRLGAKEKY